MTPAAFTYLAPSTLEEAVGLLRATGSMPLAGGQSLVPALQSRVITPHSIVDLNRIQDLPGIELRADRITTGALVRMQQVLDNPDIVQRLPLLADAISCIAHRAIRNRGTVVGSLCQLDPWAELPVVASALEARFTIAGPAGTRHAQFSDFATAPNRPALSAGELVVSVDWPVWPHGHFAGFAEVSRRPNDPAVACAAALIELDADQRAQRVVVALGAVTDLPVRCRSVESALTGQPVHRLAALASAHIGADLPPHAARDDVLADPAYRNHLAPIVVARAIEQALSKER